MQFQPTIEIFRYLIFQLNFLLKNIFSGYYKVFKSKNLAQIVRWLSKS